MSDQPLYKHDCDRCTFLGNYNGHDLYFCNQFKSIPTVVARFGNELEEYKSGLGILDTELLEAATRAKEKGILKETMTPGLKKAFEKYKKQPSCIRNGANAHGVPTDAISVYKRQMTELADTIQHQLLIIERSSWVDAFIVNDLVDIVSLHNFFIRLDDRCNIDLNEHFNHEVIKLITELFSNIREFVKNESTSNLIAISSAIIKEQCMQDNTPVANVYNWFFRTKRAKFLLWEGKI